MFGRSAAPSAVDAVGRVGLWFVDGHADFLDGWSSPTGEAADMELAILTGAGLECSTDPPAHRSSNPATL